MNAGPAAGARVVFVLPASITWPVVVEWIVIRAGNGIGLKTGSYPGMILGQVSVVLFGIARSDAGS